MLKIIGAILVFLCCTGYGMKQAYKYRERPKQLHLLQTAFQGLQTEIGYGATPLPEALLRISQRMQGPVAEWLRKIVDGLLEGNSSVDEIFRKTLTNQRGLQLSKEDHDVMIQFASTLGVSDRQDQIKHLRLLAISLQQLEKQASDDRIRLGKMWVSIGPLGGLLIIILLY